MWGKSPVSFSTVAVGESGPVAGAGLFLEAEIVIVFQNVKI